MRQSSGESGSRSFWATLPGIITALAGLLTAVAGILAVALGQGGTEGPSRTVGDSARAADVAPSGDEPQRSAAVGTAELTRTDWASQADAVCQEAVSDNAALGDPEADIASYAVQAAEIERDVVADLRALPAPSDDQGRIAQLASSWLQAADHLDTLAVSVSVGDIAGADQARRDAKASAASGNAIADALGADTCAYGEF